MVSNEAHDAMMAHAKLKEEIDRLIELSETLARERDRIRSERNALREFENRVSAALIEDGCGDEFWNAIQAAHNDYLEARQQALDDLTEQAQDFDMGY